MGFLSSLFGSSKSQPATTTNVISQKLPEEIAPFAKEVLGEAQQLYKANIERGYDPFTGQTIAPFTPEQQRSMEGISGLVGTSKPLQEEALATYRQGAEQFTGDTAQQYMSPYQQAVTDIEKREAQRNFEGNVLPRLEAQAVQQGAMSGLGSRAGVEFAEAQRNQAQLLSDIQAKGQQAAFQDARQGFEQQKAREQGMASNLSRLGPAMFASGLQEQGALGAVGEQKQQLAQSALDEAYFKFLEEEQYPQQQLANYSGFVYGNPAAGLVNSNQTGTATPFQPSFGQQLLGAGLQLGGAFLGSEGGSKAIANKFFPTAKTGGGIAGLIKKQKGGGLGQDLEGFPAETPENMVQLTKEVEAPVDPAQVGKDRTEVIKNLALQGGSFPSLFTPKEINQQAEEKKARRAEVMEQIMQGKGQLTLGRTLMAFGQGISKGGGLEIGKALEKMTDELMAERKDLSKLEAQNLLANLDIDELAIDTIRKLPKQMQLILAARKKSKLADDKTKAEIKNLDPKNKLRKDIEKLSLGLGGKEGEGFIANVNAILTAQNPEKYEAKYPGAGDVIEDLTPESTRLVAVRAATLMKENPGTTLNNATLIAFDQLYRAGQLKEETIPGTFGLLG
tara:strand:- start:1826 stop:3682 length:1857 start_codon:yes stop_codon:yes gene_type:complete